jgi:hypothetical protein
MTRAMTAAAAAMVLTICLAGCKTDHESLTKDSISKMKEMVSVLKGVTDESSAKAAGPKLEAISKDMKNLQAEMKKLGEPPKEKQEELAKKYVPELMSAQGEVMKEMMRISSDPKLAKAMGDSMRTIKSEGF